MLYELVIYTLFIGHLLLLWFKTDAAGTYGRLFFSWVPLRSWQNYLTIKADLDPTLQGPYTLLTHLKQYHQGFFVSLLSCPICVATWLGVCASIVPRNVALLASGFLGLFAYHACARMMDHADRPPGPDPDGHRVLPS